MRWRDATQISPFPRLARSGVTGAAGGSARSKGPGVSGKPEGNQSETGSYEEPHAIEDAEFFLLHGRLNFR
jgi:hypothetical protein